MAQVRKGVVESQRPFSLKAAAAEQNCLRKEEEEMHWIDPLKVEEARCPSGVLCWREP